MGVQVEMDLDDEVDEDVLNYEEKSGHFRSVILRAKIQVCACVRGAFARQIYRAQTDQQG